MSKCEHKTATVMEYHGNVTLSECDWGCGSILIIVKGDDGISHEFTADELLTLRKFVEKVDLEAGAIISNEASHINLYYDAMQELATLRQRVASLEKLQTAVNEYRDLWLNRKNGNYNERIAAHDQMLIMAIETTAFTEAANNLLKSRADLWQAMANKEANDGKTN